MFRLKSNIIIILSSFFFITQTDGLDFILESDQDFEKYGFTCSVYMYPEETCELKSIASPAQLPDYFPPRFRNLSWTEEDLTRGGRVFYVEGSGLGKRFMLRTNRTTLPTAKIIMIKSAKFYTEVYQGFGIWKGYEPDQWYYPGSDPDFTGTWIAAKKGPIDAFGDMIEIILTHNQLNELTVFTSIQILLDPPPVKTDEITQPSDFARLGFTFSTQDAEIRNVSNGADLPAYFPEAYKSLLVSEGEMIMWLEVDETLPFRRHRFAYHPELPNSPENMRPFPAVVQITFIGRTTPLFSGSFGFGPHMNWVGDRNLYTNFSLNYDEWGFGVNNNKAMMLYYFIEWDGVGLFAYNNHIDDMSVFRKISFSYYYWEEDVVTTTTGLPSTTRPTTTTTRANTSPTTTTTRATTSPTTTTLPTTTTTDVQTTSQPATTLIVPSSSVGTTTTTTTSPTTLSTQPTTASSGVMLTDKLNMILLTLWMTGLYVCNLN